MEELFRRGVAMRRRKGAWAGSSWLASAAIVMAVAYAAQTLAGTLHFAFVRHVVEPVSGRVAHLHDDEAPCPADRPAVDEAGDRSPRLGTPPHCTGPHLDACVLAAHESKRETPRAFSSRSCCAFHPNSQRFSAPDGPEDRVVVSPHIVAPKHSPPCV